MDVGDQALIRGLDTAFPILRPGLFLSYCGRRSYRPQSANGSSPTVAPPPPMREKWVVTRVWAGVPPSKQPT